MLINLSRKPEPEGITEPKDKPAVEEEKLSVVNMICREFAGHHHSGLVSICPTCTGLCD